MQLVTAGRPQEAYGFHRSIFGPCAARRCVMKNIAYINFTTLKCIYRTFMLNTIWAANRDHVFSFYARTCNNNHLLVLKAYAVMCFKKPWIYLNNHNAKCNSLPCCASKLQNKDVVACSLPLLRFVFLGILLGGAANTALPVLNQLQNPVAHES